MMENTLLKTLFLRLYRTIFKKRQGRPDKMKIEHYFETWYYILRTGIPWRCIQSKLHWSTYYKKFLKLVNIGFFTVLHTCAIKVAQQTGNLTKQDLKKLYIDATLIKNIQGIDLLGKNRTDRNRLGNKLTLIITDSGFPLAISLTAANQSDVSQVLPTIQNVTCKILHSRIIGDKGYISDALKKQLRKKKIYLIYPYRKNQKKQNSSREKRLLATRYKIENHFARYQQFRKLRLRYEKDSFHLFQWYYLALSVVTCQKILL